MSKESLAAELCKHDVVTFKSTTAICADCGHVIPPLIWDEIKKFYVRESKEAEHA